ncbi:MAG: NUDIX hydrolase [Peptoniphilaceae bacterium]|nr:NUDIX hydrolase [Peptoniphilaceae bacterium]MDD7434752.1 NUDIX hydrolase [Peptoniphilaceae bacterium]MDY3075765.1 NUDIX hydrolase [Peptoniphilaceae bacterium]MDY3987215.1 NUDIX hydrolase [Peptoniphilaceae bacterium]MDY4195816.1 NUDIX hydrolase [Peptoniphilaceae bacterium]
MQDEHFEQRTVKSEIIYDGKIINVRVDTVELPDMKYAKREIVDHAQGVGIVAVTERGTMYMVRQYRVAVKKMLLEIPAGLVDPGENPQEAAIRELQEEVGYQPKQIQFVLDSYASPGFTNERLSIFVATDLEPHALKMDETEFLESFEYPIEELFEMVQNLEITDAKSIIGIGYAYYQIYLPNRERFLEMREKSSSSEDVL